MIPGLTTRQDPPRLLVAVAHPDDETFGCGSILAHAADAGWVTTVLCATRGEAGNPAPGFDLAGRPLAEHREDELRAAARLLGVQHLVLLDFLDSGMEGEPPAGSLAAADPAEVLTAVRTIATQHDPDLVLTLDASDGHRDHVVMRATAVSVAAEREVPAYLQALPRSLMDRWVEHMTRVRPEMAHLRLADLGTPDDEITVQLDSSAQLPVREKAIAVHASQTSPYDGLPADLRRDFLARDHLVRA